MKTEKIGRVRFFPSTYSAEIGEADVEFTTCAETGIIQLLINLDTKDSVQAIERGRRITRLWQLAEDFAQGDLPAPDAEFVELRKATANLQNAILEEFLFVIRFWKGIGRRFVGRGRAPGPSLQDGPVSRTSMQDVKQSKCQE